MNNCKILHLPDNGHQYTEEKLERVFTELLGQ